MNTNNTYKTVNRRWLMNQVAKGNMVARKSYDADGEVEKEFTPARLSEGHSDWKSGFVNFQEYEFQGAGGRASMIAGGDEYKLYIHSNLTYTFKMIEK